MIGLMVLGALGLWLIITIFLSNKIPQWLGLVNHRAAISWALFPLIFVAPIADDLVGMWQFRRLCENESVVRLSPGWESVRKAIRVDLPKIELGNTAIPIYTKTVHYKDIETGRIFLRARWFATWGGFLSRHSGLANPVQCRPKNLDQIYKKVDIDKLTKHGDSK